MHNADNNLTTINKQALEASLRESVTSRETLSGRSPEIARIYTRSLFDRGAWRHSRSRYRANLSQDFAPADTATESMRLQKITCESKSAGPLDMIAKQGPERLRGAQFREPGEIDAAAGVRIAEIAMRILGRQRGCMG